MRKLQNNELFRLILYRKFLDDYDLSFISFLQQNKQLLLRSALAMNLLGKIVMTSLTIGMLFLFLGSMLLWFSPNLSSWLFIPGSVLFVGSIILGSLHTIISIWKDF
ncbi:hypothetical protein NIES4072_52890 [Nostoc commune NIES-4072]|uniref:Uncharacterized protein n=1 Tax=Nostoc commune NIES-4072 TaxID=2005467 RepID=A0A2R5FS63_NOSCO|nr:hypothetical protein NIES4070_38060 [Nostoc commune HK-02]GBG21602.1 hypothetical protein NIES4072_52890 [Nostoc commune NIES-4072]